jgi:hypothetical protein
VSEQKKLDLDSGMTFTIDNTFMIGYVCVRARTSQRERRRYKTPITSAMNNPTIITAPIVKPAIPPGLNPLDLMLAMGGKEDGTGDKAEINEYADDAVGIPVENASEVGRREKEMEFLSSEVVECGVNGTGVVVGGTDTGRVNMSSVVVVVGADERWRQSEIVENVSSGDVDGGFGRVRERGTVKRTSDGMGGLSGVFVGGDGEGEEMWWRGK